MEVLTTHNGIFEFLWVVLFLQNSSRLFCSYPVTSLTLVNLLPVMIHCCGFHRDAGVPVLSVVHGRQQPEWGDESVWLLYRSPKLFLQLAKPRGTKTHRCQKSWLSPSPVCQKTFLSFCHVSAWASLYSLSVLHVRVSVHVGDGGDERHPGFKRGFRNGRAESAWMHGSHDGVDWTHAKEQHNPQNRRGHLHFMFKKEAEVCMATDDSILENIRKEFELFSWMLSSLPIRDMCLVSFLHGWSSFMGKWQIQQHLWTSDFSSQSWSSTQKRSVLFCFCFPATEF